MCAGAGDSLVCRLRVFCSDQGRVLHDPSCEWEYRYRYQQPSCRSGSERLRYRAFEGEMRDKSPKGPSSDNEDSADQRRAFAAEGGTRGRRQGVDPVSGACLPGVDESRSTCSRLEIVRRCRRTTGRRGMVLTGFLDPLPEFRIRLCRSRDLVVLLDGEARILDRDHHFLLGALACLVRFFR